LGGADREVILHGLHAADGLGRLFSLLLLVLVLHGPVQCGRALADRHTDVRAGELPLKLLLNLLGEPSVGGGHGRLLLLPHGLPLLRLSSTAIRRTAAPWRGDSPHGYGRLSGSAASRR